MTKEKVIVARYNPNSLLGKIVYELRNNQVNTSQYIRDVIIYNWGYEICNSLKNVPESELQNLCIQSYLYHKNALEKARLNLKSSGISIDDQQNVQQHTIKNADALNLSQSLCDEGKEKMSQLNDTSLIDSFLPS